jgi:hypothetical protein
LIVKLAFHLAKVGTLGHHFVNAEKIIAHSDLLEILKICKWLLKQDHWTFKKNNARINTCIIFLGMVIPCLKINLKET